MSSSFTHARLIALLALMPTLMAQMSVLTWHNDLARTGQDLQETLLSPVNVASSTFGKLFSLPVDGKVDAEPLYVPGLVIPGQGTHNVVFVVTEHDSAYAFDADNGAQLWYRSLLNAGETPSDPRNCNQVTPEIGITSTPAIDPASGPHGTIYIVAMSRDAAGDYHHRLHALDLTTGADEFGGPVEVNATFPGTGVGSSRGTLSFAPGQYKERAALLIYRGAVYTAWSSHCDIFPYTGWIISYDESTLRQLNVLNLTPNGNAGSIWGAGAGPAVDSNGNLFLMTANGTFDTTLNQDGLPFNKNFGNAFVNVSTANSQRLMVADYFTMSNTAAESGADEDLGSGGLLLMPPVTDAGGNPRSLAVGAGKDGNVYVVDRNNLGKFQANQNAIYQELPGAVGSVFSSPAWFNGTLFYGGVGDSLKAFSFSGGAFGSSPASKSAHTFGYPGTTPSISANGSANGIAWAAENGSVAVLHAFDATDLSKELYSSNQAANSRDHFGAGNKFITPMIANGKVYVGATNSVGVLGLLNCTYRLGSSITSVSSAAAAGSVTVTTSPGCGWSVSNNTSFVTINSGASGSGTGSVSYSIANNDGPPRTGTLNIAGQTYQVTQAGTSTSSGLGFFPLTPCRIADTRRDQGHAGAYGPPSLTSYAKRDFPIATSSCASLSSALAYSLNLTVVPPGPLDFLSVWPAGQIYPGVSALNSPASEVVANAAIVPAGNNGAITTVTSRSTDLIVDINGYFGLPNGQELAFYPVPPCRVADTRVSQGKTGAFGPPSLAAYTSRDFPIQSGGCAIPATAEAYSLNMTVVPGGRLDFLSVWPTGQSYPGVSTLNSTQGEVVANAAIVPAGTNSSIRVVTGNPTDLIIDINGYFAQPGGQGALHFYPVTPCRVADTRASQGKTGPFGPPGLAAFARRDFPISSGDCGIPIGAQVYSLNLTAVPQGPLSFLSAWPAGLPYPGVSTLNSTSGAVRANAALVPAGTGGAISVVAGSPTDLIIDISGYFAP